MKLINNITLTLATLLLLAAGCTDEADGNGTGNIAPGTLVEVNFDAPGVESNNPATRAAMTSPLPTDATVRITPYNKSKSRFETSVVYKVEAYGGVNRLVPNDGAGTGMKLIMSDTYVFYTSIPATKAITSEGHKLTVANNEDFASCVSGNIVITNYPMSGMATDYIQLPTLVRRCAQITVVVKTKDAAIKGIGLPSDGFVKVSGLRSAQAGIAPGAAIPTTGGTTDQSFSPTAKASSNSMYVYTESFCVLPGVQSLDIAARVEIALNVAGSEFKKVVTYGGKVTFTEPLKPGFAYDVTLFVSPENAEVLPEVTVTEWDMSGGSLPIEYPYVTTNGVGNKNVIVVKDIHGQGTVEALFGTTPKSYILHKPWFQTPDFSGAQSIIATQSGVSPMFEVAVTDASATPVLYDGTTNGPCVIPWRRPTLFELRLIERMNFTKRLEVDAFRSGYYRAAERYSSTASWGSDITDPTNKIATNYDVIEDTETAYTRCVRDIEFSPSIWDEPGNLYFLYPYVVGGKYVVFHDVNGGGDVDVSYVPHPKWEQTPYCEATNDPYAPGNTVYWGTIEVSDVVHPLSKWMSTNGPCISPWRTPTPPELLMIFQARDYLNISFPPGSPFWTSVTSGLDMEGYVGFYVYHDGGEAKLTSDRDERRAYTRCVRDL